jgi:hypothetical protein
MYSHLVGFALLMARVGGGVHYSASGMIGRNPMVDHRKREQETEREVEEEAATEPQDPITSREALEEELMEEGRSDEGEHIP